MAAHNKAKPEEIARIRELRRSGMSAVEIAKVVGRSKSTVHRYAPAPRSRPDVELARQLRSEGKSTADIASMVGKSPRTIQRWAPVSKPRVPYRPPYPPETKEAARALLEDRVGYIEASRTLGVDPRTLARWFPNLGLTNDESRERALMIRHYGGVLR